MTVPTAKGVHTGVTEPPPQPPAIIEIVEPLDMEKLASAFRKFEDFKTKVLTDVDAINIQGHRVVKRSGWSKWRLACNVSDRIVEQERTPRTGRDADGHFSWRVITEVSHHPTGRSSMGVAICSSAERKSWTHEEHDVYATAATRSKNRATSDLIGGGELSAEELETEAEPQPQASPGKASTTRPATRQSSWTDTTGSK